MVQQLDRFGGRSRVRTDLACPLIKETQQIKQPSDDTSFGSLFGFVGRSGCDIRHTCSHRSLSAAAGVWFLDIRTNLVVFNLFSLVTFFPHLFFLFPPTGFKTYTCTNKHVKTKPRNTNAQISFHISCHRFDLKCICVNTEMVMWFYKQIQGCRSGFYVFCEF